MIKDRLDQIDLYKNSIPCWDKVVEILGQKDLAQMKPERYKIEGSLCTWGRSDFQTREYLPENFEVHKKFIDIHLVLEGDEVIHTAPLSRLNFDGKGYNKENDIEFGVATKFDSVYMAAGDFAVFYPGDAHNPCCKAGMDSMDVKKLVIKIPVEGLSYSQG